MGTYIKTFDQHTEYETYINSENAVLPNMSYCRDNNHAYFNQKPDPYNGHEYVDLGLPSGTMWAKCNVGAETETDWGDYFQWADPEPATNRPCDSANYKWYGTTSDADENNITKYNSIDSKQKLEPCDDMAHVNMGGEWYMADSAEWEELTANTTNELVSNYKNSGVDGRLYRGKNMYSGSTLFFPKSGWRQNNNTNRNSIRIYNPSMSSMYGSNSANHVNITGNYIGQAYPKTYAIPVRGVVKL